MRTNGRAWNSIRSPKITRGFPSNAPGSVLIEAGNTVLLCTASWTEQVPGWMIGSGRGWVTAEYSMLPGSTHQRKQRDRNGRTDGRSVEIQRLIGRSLRAGIDLNALPEVSLWVDCDVLSADGGTRTWAITGAWIALHDALTALQQKKKGMKDLPILQWITATSVGMVKGEPLLDLCYQEDSNADVDMNVVYTSKGEFAEVQMSGEKATLDRKGLDTLLDLAEEGCKQLLQIQEQVLEAKA